MDWMQVLFLFFSNAALIVWFRSESRQDWRHMDAKVDAMRHETKASIDALRQETKVSVDALRHETKASIDAIHEEMKDFHGRLCAIEERRSRRD